MTQTHSPFVISILTPFASVNTTCNPRNSSNCGAAHHEGSGFEENKYAILRVFKEVKLYFEENPVYGVTFPDVEWPV